MLHGIVVVVVALGVAPAAQRSPRQSARIVERGEGRVYLDKGAAAGLSPGMKVRAFDKKRAAGECVVEHVSDRWASCAGKVGARAGRASFVAEPVAKTPPDEPKRSTTTAAEREAARARLASAAFPVVAHERVAKKARAWRFPATLAARHQSWTVTPTGDRTFHKERVELGMRGAQLGLDGLRAFARVNVEGRLARPATTRFLPDDVARLEVFEAALAYRPREGWGSVAVGRLMPFRIPGVTVLDGAEASARLLGGALEVGAYGGTVPDLTTGMPSLTRVSAGTFLGAELAFEDLRVGQRGRVGLVAAPDLGRFRAELDAVVDVAYTRALFVALGAGAGIGDDEGSLLPGLDHAFVEAALAPTGALSLHGGYRYRAPLALDVDDARYRWSYRGGGHHGDAHVRWAMLSWLETRLSSGVAVDVNSNTWRAWAGPDVSLPRLFGGFGGVELGYREELGALEARALFTTVRVSAFERVRLSTTLSAWEEPALFEQSREAMLSAEARLTLFSWLFVEARGHTAAPMPSEHGYPRPGFAGGYGELAVVGAL